MSPLAVNYGSFENQVLLKQPRLLALKMRLKSMRAGLQRTNIQNSIFTTKMDVFESEIPIAMTLKNLRVRKAIDATSYSLFDKDKKLHLGEINYGTEK